ncbi:ribose-phosphate pyrophosphokinase [Spirochaetia bacterium]|nr:ribose-phosphate pyrophosphokinase [Spirochaetia bacterium]
MDTFVIAATRSMQDYAARVAGVLNKGWINAVDALTVDCFANGEMEVRVSMSPRGKTVFLFAGCGGNNPTVDESKLELYHAIDALNRAQSARIIVFEPFISCSRSDRTVNRSSVGLWMHFRTLQAMGARQLITYQLHSDKSRTMLDPSLCTLDDIPGSRLLIEHLCATYVKSSERLRQVVPAQWAFCAIDAGGEKLARNFANFFGTPLVVAHKQRNYSQVNTVDSINILSAVPLQDKILWIVDDIIDTAGSIDILIRALALRKPAQINVAVVHAVFSDPATERIRNLCAEKLLAHIIVTDTVCSSPSLSGIIPNMEIVSSSEFSAMVLETIVHNESITELVQIHGVDDYFVNI